MARWHDGNGFSSWYSACARVGYGPKKVLSGLRAECDRCSYPNLVLSYGGGGIENVSGFLAINEMMMQSHDGVLRFFPAWPQDLDARFGNLRAVGAFLVSAAIRGGIVEDASIVSEKGLRCTIVNPWPESTVTVIRDGRASGSVSGPRFELETRPGERIELRRRRGSRRRRRPGTAGRRGG